MDVEIYLPSRLRESPDGSCFSARDPPRILPGMEFFLLFLHRPPICSTPRRSRQRAHSFSLPLFLFPLQLIRCGTDPVSGPLRWANALPLLTFVSLEAIQS